MRKLITATHSTDGVQPRFHSVAETARILGVSDMTVYRAIRTGQFPAVQLMGRLIIPAKVIDEIIDAAIDGGVLVDTQDWTPDGRVGPDADERTSRPTRGATDAPGGAR